MESTSEMRTTTIVFAMFLVITSAYSQTQRDTSANAQAAAPLPRIDTAAVAGSARASKLIGSKVYMGDTAIGQIEDLLVALDQAHCDGGNPLGRWLSRYR